MCVCIYNIYTTAAIIEYSYNICVYVYYCATCAYTHMRYNTYYLTPYMSIYTDVYIYFIRAIHYIPYTILHRLSEFLVLGGTKLVSLYSGLLTAVLYCILDREGDIQMQAKRVNQQLSDLIRYVGVYVYTMSVGVVYHILVLF